MAIEQSVKKEGKREPLLRQAIRNVEEVNTKLTAKAQMAKTEIDKCYPKLIKALQERHKLMLNEVDKMFHGKAKVLTFQQRGLEVDLENLLNTCKVTGMYINHVRDRFFKQLRLLVLGKSAATSKAKDFSIVNRIHIR